MVVNSAVTGQARSAKTEVEHRRLAVSSMMSLFRRSNQTGHPIPSQKDTGKRVLLPPALALPYSQFLVRFNEQHVLWPFTCEQKTYELFQESRYSFTWSL